MPPEPKPCPFCGSDKVRVVRRSGKTGTACVSRYYRERVVCECGASSGEEKAPGYAVSKWNRRTPPTDPKTPELERAA
jgi:Lar family restriction alleviation protein